MVLRFKNPSEDNLKKVMVYGADGSGKSTFATEYVQKNDLSAVVIDIEDTNKTSLFYEGRVLQLDLKNDITAFANVKKAIDEIAKSKEFDTIVFDGLTTYLDMLTSNAKGLAKYSDRALRFQKVLQALLDSKKHIIFIGQIDMEVIFTEDFQSPKAIIKVNALVNEKYFCYVDEKGNFTYETKKFRTVDNAANVSPKKHIIEEVSHEPVTPNIPKMMHEPISEEFITAKEMTEETFVDDPVRNQCILIKDMLMKENTLVSKSTMRSKVVKLINDGVLPKENRSSLIKYIDKNCPEGLEE